MGQGLLLGVYLDTCKRAVEGVRLPAATAEYWTTHRNPFEIKVLRTRTRFVDFGMNTKRCTIFLQKA